MNRREKNPEQDGNPVLEILRDANARLGENCLNLVGLNESTYRRWFRGDGQPTPGSAKHAGESLWRQLAQATDQVRKAILDKVTGFQKPPEGGWSEQTLGSAFHTLADGFRRQLRRDGNAIQSKQEARLGRSTMGNLIGAQRLGPGSPSRHHAYDPSSPIYQRVNQLFESAGLPVFDGQVSCGAEVQVHLGPLYAYLEELQRSARIANQFAPGGLIELNELYVELSAAEDQRDGGGFASGGEGVSDVLEADLPTARAVTRWRSRVEQHRIPLEALVSRTEVLPAVLFGDPGAGKSTLTTYLLHALGQGLVTQRGLMVEGALPFHISLREFTLAGELDHYEIIPYLLRHRLRVPAEDLDSWRTVLGHFFRDQRPYRLLLIVDGVDEATPSPQVFAQLRRQFGNMTAVSRLIFTSRRAGFLPPVAGYAAFELLELTEPTMFQLVQNWFRCVHPRSESFVHSFLLWLFADPARHDMARNPCLLSLLCYLNQARPDNGFIQAANRAELYRLAVEKLTSDADRLPATGREEGLDALAAFALDRYVNLGPSRGPHALFSREEARQFLEHHQGIVPVAERVAAGSPLARHLDAIWLQTRLVGKWSDRDWYCFLHLSFQEFLAARCLVTRPEVEVEALLSLHRFNPFWREVWRFYAGLCREQGIRGESRFGALARAYVSRRDLYEQCLFWFAPLSAEYGLRDTRRLLGFDLRVELNRHVTSGRAQTLAHIRMMVDMDPEYFLDQARSVLDRQVSGYTQRAHLGRRHPLPDEAQVRLAAAILGCIYHPSAVEYQRKLIEKEAHWPDLKPVHPSLGPSARSGRNEPLTQALRRWLSTAAGPLQRERLVNYLARTGGPDAALALLEAAIALSDGPRRRPTAQRSERLRFQVHCLWALAELQDRRVVQLAEVLWGNRRFREEHLFEACNCLTQVKDPAVSKLVEDWLASPLVKDDPFVLEPLLVCLKGWPERPVPARVEQLVENRATPPVVRAHAWEVLVRRGGFPALLRFRKRLTELGAARRWTESETEELTAEVLFVTRHRLPLEPELSLLLARAKRFKAPKLLDALWGSLTAMKAAQSSTPVNHDWFEHVCLPALRHHLTHGPHDAERPVQFWLDGFRTAPEEILLALRDSVASVWDSLQPNVRLSVLQFLTDLPRYAPLEKVKRAVASQDQNERQAAADIIVAAEPGALLDCRTTDPLIEKSFLRASVVDGTLFFADGYYAPGMAQFISYVGE